MKKDILGIISREIARRKRRKKLTNHDFSIISNSCIGGVISNSLKERFNSPTVNLIIDQDDFIIFCNHLKEYSKCLLELPDEIEKKSFQVSYPVGMIRGRDYNLPDIAVRFIHYSSFDEAKDKWNSRFKRVNYRNLFFVMERGMYASDSILDAFTNLPYDNKVFLTEKKDLKRWPYNYNYSFYTDKLYVVGDVYNSFNIGLAQYRWLDEFDYISWLNSGKIQSNRFIKDYINTHFIEG